MVSITPLFVPTPGAPELLIILFVAILLFGANKIPKLARSTGEAIGEFQKGQEKVEKELEELRQEGADAVEGDFDRTPTQSTDESDELEEEDVVTEAESEDN